MLPQLLASLPLKQSLKNFMLDEISTSIFSQSLDENFQSKSFIKRTCKRDDASMGVQIPTSSFRKVELNVLAINSKPLFMTNLEIK
jgi:hypothetical protein